METLSVRGDDLEEAVTKLTGCADNLAGVYVVATVSDQQIGSGDLTVALGAFLQRASTGVTTLVTALRESSAKASDVDDVFDLTDRHLASAAEVN